MLIHKPTLLRLDEIWNESGTVLCKARFNTMPWDERAGLVKSDWWAPYDKHVESILRVYDSVNQIQIIEADSEYIYTVKVIENAAARVKQARRHKRLALEKKKLRAKELGYECVAIMEKHDCIELSNNTLQIFESRIYGGENHLPIVATLDRPLKSSKE